MKLNIGAGAKSWIGVTLQNLPLLLGRFTSPLLFWQLRVGRKALFSPFSCWNKFILCSSGNWAIRKKGSYLDRNYFFNPARRLFFKFSHIDRCSITVFLVSCAVCAAPNSKNTSFFMGCFIGCCSRSRTVKQICDGLFHTMLIPSLYLNTTTPLVSKKLPWTNFNTDRSSHYCT